MTSYLIKYLAIFVVIIALFYWGMNRHDNGVFRFMQSDQDGVKNNFIQHELNRTIARSLKTGAHCRINGIPASMSHYRMYKPVGMVIRDLITKSGIDESELVKQQFGTMSSLSWFDAKNELYQCYLIGHNSVTKKTDVYPTTLHLKDIKKNRDGGKNVPDMPRFPTKFLDFHFQAIDVDQISDSFIHVVQGYTNSAIQQYKSKMLSLGWKEEKLKEETAYYRSSDTFFFTKGSRECIMSFQQVPKKNETMVCYTVINK